MFVNPGGGGHVLLLVGSIAGSREEESKMALSAAQQKLTRTDWKKEKELEEARKAGTAPALQDEEGK